LAEKWVTALGAGLDIPKLAPPLALVWVAWLAALAVKNY
jgi:hypothetical protein